jgi:MurNAc alpha-1-phosphate uridylyltransferase
MIAMLLAAGRGERLRPLTDEVPKSLVEIQGQSLLERHLENIRDARVETVVINLGWLGGKIVERVGSGMRYGLDVIYSQEGDNVLETGGGIHKALPLLGKDPFLVVNADVYTDMPIPDIELAANILGHNDEAARLTFSGVAIYRPEFFTGCEAGRFPLAPMLREAADAGQLSGALYEGLWADIGTKARLDAANRP